MPKPPIRKAQSLDIQRTIQQAASFQREGRLKDAERLYQAVLKVQPNHFDALHLLGVLRGQEGNREMAVKLISRALQRKPDSAEALANLGNALAHSSRHDEAIVSFDKALAIRPDSPGVLEKRGIALAKLNRHEEAIATFDKALALQPEFINVLCERARSFQALNRFEQAITSYDRVLAITPRHILALAGRGIALAGLTRHDEAIETYNKALEIEPNDVAVINNRGVSLAKLKRHEEAIASFDKALSIKPEYTDALNNRGIVLGKLDQHHEALLSFNRALAARPDHVDALCNRGNALFALQCYEDAISSLERALKIKPDHVDALSIRGNILMKLRRHAEAIASYHKALAIKPDLPYAAGYTAHCRALVCDWSNRHIAERQLIDDLRSGKTVTTPFCLLSFSDSPADQLTCATLYVQNRHPPIPTSLNSNVRYQHERIHVAYLSGDFHDHATAYLIAGLLEQHDRARFETIGISFGPVTQSEMRSRLMSGFERFIDVRRKSDKEVASLLRDLEVDIAVDLKGSTGDSRPGILASRPAPIQVNYLGYPGTMGASYIDYIIADEFVIPRDQQRYYLENVVYLPDCYQVNDSKRKISEHTSTRAEARLPEERFVFCCFNKSYKITPQMFDIWMRLLKNVENAVLWLIDRDDVSATNLRCEAQARGVDPNRLVFAPHAKLENHLARHRLADLFLDTLPYNAHTTASDALWAGLPVLTCAGSTFAGRVAGSLLHAVGLPELVTYTLEDYEALALQLATDEILLRDIKDKLARNRLTKPLFDTVRFRRHIEAAYTTMWEIHQRGEKPRSFAVSPLDQTP